MWKRDLAISQPGQTIKGALLQPGLPHEEAECGAESNTNDGGG